MGQIITKLSENFLDPQDQGKKQEVKSMLHDVTLDDDETMNVTTNIEGEDILNTPITPPSVIKLKFDPRSPSEFDRTPIKIPLDEVK